MASKIQTTNASGSAMARLLAAHQNKVVTLKKGDTVKGTISRINKHEILVDVGSKTEAMVLEKDKKIFNRILALFKAGDKVEVNVLNPESDSGQPVVSLRRYLSNIAWDKLEELEKSKEQIEVFISDISKAGYIVTTDFGITGFLPQSHIAHTQQDLSTGAQVKVTVLEINRQDNKIIFSQKPAISDEEFKKATKHLKEGGKVSGEVISATPVGIYISIFADKDGKKQPLPVEGFVHISELSWDKVNDPSELFDINQKVEAVVLRSDTEAKRITLSIKRLTQDPFEELIKNYPLDKKVEGIVVRIEENGVILTIDDKIEGFIKKDKIPPGTAYTAGQKVPLLVSEHDKRRHRLNVSPVLLEKPLGYR